MTTESKLLSDCGNEYVIDDKYKVEIETGDYLVVETGTCVGKAAANFTHPNVAATAKRVYEFRTYFKSGRKKWNSKAGVSNYFVIPKSAIKLLPEKGYSYVQAEINGVKVQFNVSGGSGFAGVGVWTDMLRINTQISMNHPIRDLKKIAEVAVRGTSLEPIQVKALEPQEEINWNQLAAKAKGNVKEEIVALIEAGKKPVVKLASGYQYSEGKAIEVVRRYVRTKTGENTWQWGETGPIKALVIEADGHWGKLRAKLSQIDWYLTAQANGLAA